MQTLIIQKTGCFYYNTKYDDVSIIFRRQVEVRGTKRNNAVQKLKCQDKIVAYIQLKAKVGNKED